MKRFLAALTFLLTIPILAQVSGPARRIVRGPSLPATCTDSQIFFKTTATKGSYQCVDAAWASFGGGVSGSLGATDNAVLRADGTGGATAQGSLVTISDTGSIITPGAANRIGTATTDNANADTMFSASGTTKTPLHVQALASPTADWFKATNSANTRGFYVQSDGGVIIDQATGATYTSPLDVKYQGTRIFDVTYLGALNVINNLNLTASTGAINFGSGRAYHWASAVGTVNWGLSTAGSATPQAFIQVLAENGVGADKTGANATIRPGNGTGAGGSGSLLFQTAPVAASSSTANTMATRLTINKAGTVTAEGPIQQTGSIAKPTCDSTMRGATYYTPGGAGVADTYELCAKAAADTYAWRALITVP